MSQPHKICQEKIANSEKTIVWFMRTNQERNYSQPGTGTPRSLQICFKVCLLLVLGTMAVVFVVWQCQTSWDPLAVRTRLQLQFSKCLINLRWSEAIILPLWAFPRSWRSGRWYSIQTALYSRDWPPEGLGQHPSEHLSALYSFLFRNEGHESHRRLLTTDRHSNKPVSEISAYLTPCLIITW